MKFDDFQAYYLRHGKTPNQMQRPKNALNEAQLERAYDRYVKSAQKKEETTKRLQTKKYKSTVDFKQDLAWTQVKGVIAERDDFRCQCLFFAPPGFNEPLGGLDPCHVFRKSTHNHMRYMLENVVTLHRLFHTRLDQYKHPFTGESIGYDATYKWWEKIVGKERFKKLTERAKRK